MTLTVSESAITVFALAAGSIAMRFIPPLLFPNNKKHPKIIDELTPMIPPAVIGLLAVYSMKDICVFSGNHGMPEIVATAAVIFIHLLKRNMLLSIIVGTVCYMLLLRIL